jgi:hypothetical protein
LVRFGGQYWDVVLPPGWEGSHDPECDLIFDPMGYGALQVSAALESAEVTEQDLLDLARDDLSTGISPRPVSLGDFQGFTFAYNQGDQHWQRWFLRHSAVALFITYNCPLFDDGRENVCIEAMLRSLRVRLPTP